MEARAGELAVARDAVAGPARDGVPVDWTAPWYDLVRPDLDLVRDDAQAGRFGVCRRRLDDLAVARGLRNENGHAVRFADAAGIDAHAYEAHIWSTGRVPTRCTGEGAWHDLFNALVWLALPRTKARLNRLQAGVIARDGVRGVRGGLRDAATLFDENAVLLVTHDDALVDALRGFDWPALFVAGRERFTECSATRCWTSCVRPTRPSAAMHGSCARHPNALCQGRPPGARCSTRSCRMRWTRPA